jgi:hypothetical protein
MSLTIVVVYYEGAEYPPNCAAERWALVNALAHFGTFRNLDHMLSASSYVFNPLRPPSETHKLVFSMSDTNYAVGPSTRTHSLSVTHRSSVPTSCSFTQSGPITSASP